MTDFIIETIPIAALQNHPRNYREHPDDQLEHIIKSIKDNGFYRNIIIAQDNTILAGHGVVKAAGKMGLTEVPVRRLPLTPDDPRALKVLAGDNEMGHLAEIDDRALSELLKEINELDVDGLLGTGFDEMMLANLVLVTRPATEIADFNEAAEWVGLPGYDNDETSKIRIIVTFKSVEDRLEFTNSINLRIDKRESLVWSTRWPFTERTDTASIRFKGQNGR